MRNPISSKTNHHILLEGRYGAHNYHPLPVVIQKGNGVHLWDIDGNKYYDFLSGYSAVNQGHCHPEIVKVFIAQAQQLTLTSRAFYNDKLGEFEKYISILFNYNKALLMNTGVEAVESGIKICRKWAYEVKGVEVNKAVIIVCSNNFHGRTLGVVSFSNDCAATNNFGPFLPGFKIIPYNDLAALALALEDKNIAGFLVEPIQGEAGVIIPDTGFLTAAFNLCKSNNVLFIADEIQTGLFRTGKLLACYHENVRPDMVLLGKALSGGMMPISAVLADDEIMMCLNPGEHGSTFGGNPLASATAKKALEVLITENMGQNAMVMGSFLRKEITNLQLPIVKEIRGKGLLNAIEINNINPNAAWDICIELMKNGLLAKPTHRDKIRLAPPLTITKEQMKEAIDIIKNVLSNA